jgi:hypothetical protein
MPGARDHLDQSTREPARSTRPDLSPEWSERPAITAAADPRLADGSSSVHADLLRVQRTAGNAALASLVAPAVQRVVNLDEMSAEVDAAPLAGAGEPAAAGESGPAADAGGAADHTITAGHIELNAPMVEAPGIIRAQTVVADSIVASSYTPGAGNQW